MNRYFADTFYWIALSNRRDQWHQRVQAFNRALTTRHFYTTEDVLGEFLDFCGGGTSETRRRAALFTRRVLTDRHITVFPQTHTSFLEGLALYESRPDKAYSLTDCISMQAMRHEGLTDVLTNDHHNFLREAQGLILGRERRLLPTSSNSQCANGTFR